MHSIYETHIKIHKLTCTTYHFVQDMPLLVNKTTDVTLLVFLLDI